MIFQYLLATHLTVVKKIGGKRRGSRKQETKQEEIKASLATLGKTIKETLRNKSISVEGLQMLIYIWYRSHSKN